MWSGVDTDSDVARLHPAGSVPSRSLGKAETVGEFLYLRAARYELVDPAGMGG